VSLYILYSITLTIRLKINLASRSGLSLQVFTN